MASQTLIDEQDDTIETAVAALLDVAVGVRRTGSTAMVHCNMCGEQDENHASTCPVPMLEQWLFDAVKVQPEKRAAIELWSEQGFTPM
jgi:hypothetical protein